MLLVVQLTANTPELKLLLHGAYVNATVLSKKVNTTNPNQPPLNIGWRIIDRSQSEASPDCLLLTGNNEEDASVSYTHLTLPTNREV